MKKFKPEGFSNDIFKSRYAFTEDETWESACERVARQMAMAETPKNVDKYQKKFKNILENNLFVPGGRIWYNSGRPDPQLLNCFVLGHELDSKEGWGNISKEMIITSMTGGGCGIDFSEVRPNGSTINKQRGTCPGPISLMKLINNNGEPVKAGGSRRVALMFSLDSDHPDVEDFIDAKMEKGELQLANVSIRSKKTTEFIKAVKNDLDWELSWKNKYKKTIKARDLWNKIVKNAYNSAEPGFLNWELVEDDSNISYIEPLVTTNPCGEIALSSYDCCCLGHLVLPRFVSNGEIDWHLLGKTVRTGVRFLDNVLTVNKYPLPEMKEKSHKLRRIGMGTTGLADMLALVGLKYGSEASIKFIDKLYRFISKSAYEASVMLAVEKGSFPACETDKHVKSGFMKRMTKKIKNLVEEHGIRNCAILTQAPTGCQKPDTMVVTDQGLLELQELGDIQGDKWQPLKNIKVSQENGQDRKVEQFFVNGYSETKKVTLSSGTELEATNNHQYRILKNGDYVWCRSDELEIGDKIIIATNTYKKSTEVFFNLVNKNDTREFEITQPKQTNYNVSKFLGYFYADGSVHHKGVRIACNAKNPNEYKKVAELGESIFGIKPTFYDNGRNCMSVCFNSQMLLRWLDANDLIKQKANEIEIPKAIRTASKRSLVGFLMGYWEADGSTSVDNRYNSKTRYIDTVSKKLSQQLVTAIRSLGYDSCIQKRTTGLGSEAYRIKLVKTKRRDETSLESRQLKDLGLYSCTLDTIIDVEDSFNLTLDISVPETVTYIANGAISHNTVSILSGNCSSGIEPMFAPAYERRYWVGDKRNTELVLHPLFKQFMDDGKDVEHFVGSRELTVRQHMEVQKTIQNHVDNAVSKTINMPEDYPIEDMKEIWLEYLPYLKGTTFYRENTRGFVMEDGTIQEPPLVALSLEEAKRRYSKDSITGKDDDDCPSGVCSI